MMKKNIYTKPEIREKVKDRIMAGGKGWKTKSGKPSTQGPTATGERYLPALAIKALTPAEYRASTQAKREAIKNGEQFSKQPQKIAKKTAKYQ